MFKAAKDIGKYIGGRMHRWRKSDVINLDKETIAQNFEPGDYESATVEDHEFVADKTPDKKTSNKK